MDAEIIAEFRNESNPLLSELGGYVEELEEFEGGDFPSLTLENFAQRVDRIMGAAKTIGMTAPDHWGLQAMGKIAELCKYTCYRAAKLRLAALLPVFAAFLADAVEMLQELLDGLEDEARVKKARQTFAPVLQKRLEWLSQRVQQQGAAAGAPLSQGSVDDEMRKILASLGV